MFTSLSAVSSIASLCAWICTLPLAAISFRRTLVFHPRYKQADVLAHVVQPAAAAGLVGVALGDAVDIAAGGQGQAVVGGCGQPCRGAEDEQRLLAGLRFGGVAVCVGVATGFPGA